MPAATSNNKFGQTLSFVYLKVNSNQNSNEEQNAVPASDQNGLPANTPQPPLENEHPGSPETIPPLILQTEPPMEVHHHGHVHETKKWKEYLFQFLMLFLAVFCGFLAENQREHMVEHQREKEYAKALYDELFADSIDVADKIRARLDKEKDCDFLWSYIRDSSLTELPKEFYASFTTVFYLINSYKFEPKDGVLNQLKSSGSLRYFKNATLQKLFGDISVAINNVRYRNEQEYQFFANPIKPFILKHYDFKWIDNLRKLDSTIYYMPLINKYRQTDTIIKASILNLPSFDRDEATNMIMFYKTMLISSRNLNMNDYIQTNLKLLQELIV